MGSETNNPLATPVPSSSFNPESLEKLLATLSPDLRVCLKAHFEKIDGRVKPTALDQQGAGRCVGEAEEGHAVVDPGLGVEGGRSMKLGLEPVQAADSCVGIRDVVGESQALTIGAAAVACKKKGSGEVLVKQAEEERLKEVRKREMEAAKKLKEEEVRKMEEMKAKSLEEDKLELAKKKKKREAVKVAAAKDLQEKEGRNVEEDREEKRAKREKRMEARKAARKAKSLEEETATNELSAESVQPNGLQNKHCGGATPRQQNTKLTDQLNLTAKIGQGLLIEIRRLQELLHERDTALENLQKEKSKLEEHVDVLEVRIRSLEESERRLQEENRDLGSVVGELRFSEQWDTETQPRAHSTQHMSERTIDLGGLKDEKQGLQEKVTEEVRTRAISLDKLDDWKALNEKRFVELEVENAKRESEFAAMVKIFVAGEDKRLALEKRIETLEWDTRRRPRPTDTNR